jgi:serralysin
MTIAIKPIIGSNGNDQLNGGNGHELLSGRGGNDLIIAGNGHDVAYGGSGNDEIHGNSGNDTLYGSGGPSFVDLSGFTIANDYEGSVIFQSESAGYKNSLGSYKVSAEGLITGVQFHFPNASLPGSGGSTQSGTESELSLQAGDQLGFFIIANGYSYNNSYQHMDFDNGGLQFRNSDGSIASVNSVNPSLWYVDQDGSETQLIYNAYHTAAGVANNNYQLNADGIAHTVGLADSDAGLVTLGFEDLYNGGDRDFDDAVFSVDVGTSNAQVLDPNIANSDTGVDQNQPTYSYQTMADGAIHKFDAAGNFIAVSEQNDEIHGCNGDDSILGGSGNDQLHGDTGADTLFGGSGNDTLKGGNDNDSLYGDNGNDNLDGGVGNDILYGGSGNDNLKGGSGDDLIYSGANKDVVDGGSGMDTVSYDYADSGVNIDLHRKKTTGGDSDTLKSIENAIGSDYRDSLRGNRLDNRLEGGNGNDVIRGMTGADVLVGGLGADSFTWRQSDLDGSLDQILDFALGEDSLNLDVSASLANRELDEWLMLEVGDDSSQLFADLDGDGDFADAIAFAELQGVSTDSLDDLSISVA